MYVRGLLGLGKENIAHLEATSACEFYITPRIKREERYAIAERVCAERLSVRHVSPLGEFGNCAHQYLESETTKL
jgi:hypothetical protein